jgi:hypothetical protein
MSVNAGEIFPVLEALEVARFKTNPIGEVLGLAGLGAELQPTIIVSPNAPVNADGRPDGTIWIQVTP